MWGPLSRWENQNGGLPAIESRGKHLTDVQSVSASNRGGGQAHEKLVVILVSFSFFCLAFPRPTARFVRVTLRES